MQIIFILLYAACIARTIQEILAHNYKKVVMCLLATVFIFLMSNGLILKGVLIYKNAVGDYVFGITCRASIVIMTFVISYALWSELRKSLNKS